MATSRMNNIVLSLGDKRFEIDLDRSYTAEQLGLMFQITAADIWLCDKYGSRVIFPIDGEFDLSGIDPYTQLEVEGVRSATSSLVTVSATPVATSRNYSGFTSVVGKYSSRFKNNNYSLRIIQARIDDMYTNDHPNFCKVGQSIYRNSGIHGKCSPYF